MQDRNNLKIDITRSSTPPVDNFRVNAIRSDYDYTVPEVTEHFTGEITRMFTSLGFSSVPSWLKPYPVLSNGEKMRADLAYTLLSATTDNPVAYDEFTSVVDRDVAHNLCLALHKHIKRTPGLRFIAVTCHSDILDWLQPDWVYSTDDMGMIDPKRSSPLNDGSPSNDVTEASGQSLSDIII